MNEFRFSLSKKKKKEKELGLATRIKIINLFSHQFKEIFIIFIIVSYYKISFFFLSTNNQNKITFTEL